MKKKKKINSFSDEVMRVLAEDYNNNIMLYSQAEKDVKTRQHLLDRLHNLNGNLKKPVSLVSDDKTIYFDFKHNEIGLSDNNYPQAILAYTLDYLSIRKVFPFTLTELVNKQASKDLSNYKLTDTKENKDKTTEIIDWVRTRVLNNNFMVNSINLNRSTGTFQMISAVKDYAIGFPTQTITVKYDPNKVVEINGESKKVKEWSDNYWSLFSYFMYSGFATQMFARCNCNEYNRNCGKKISNANFFCSHLSIAMSMMPYYLLYSLK